VGAKDYIAINHNQLNTYIDGKRDSSKSGMKRVSVNGNSEPFVCETAYGKYLKGMIRFIRI
jgi:hypothetical protein